ncbi:MAG: M23 family metallopeptidase [Nocardioidaceae bacterium]|nr:M23 family metallopeptidase [Nocardioidaceae bacterium]
MKLLRTCRRVFPGAVALALGAAVVAPLGAWAAWEPDFEAPFLCGQDWSAQSRPDHSPSVYSVDFNRDDDYRQPVRASAPGRVTAVVDLGGSSYGKYVKIDHGNGWESLYAHLDAQLVVVGQQVDQGTMIGLLGTSGGSTGPHLHFEQKQAGAVRPATFHGALLDYNTDINSYNCGDVPVAGDWNGDRRDDVGVYRQTPRGNNFRLRMPGGDVRVIAWGRPGDVPVTGDWNGNGRTDVGVWRRMTQKYFLRLDGGQTREVVMGNLRDVPITGDWNGDGVTEVGTFSPGKQEFRLRGASGAITAFSFGGVASVPVTGDWDGDRRTDVAVFDTRSTHWRYRDSRGRVTTEDFGGRGGLPFGGDWNGDGVDSAGTWGPAQAKMQLERAQKPRSFTFGRKRR